jgi:hypothetical protein
MALIGGGLESINLDVPLLIAIAAVAASHPHFQKSLPSLA